MAEWETARENEESQKSSKGPDDFDEVFIF